MALHSIIPTTRLQLKIAISPCPNDTFGFFALLTGKITTPLQFQVSLFDIETLNNAAKFNEFDVIKMSAATFGLVCDNYRLIKTGTAFGTNSGPLVIANSKNINLKTARVAIPGRSTTAYSIYTQLLGTPKAIVETPYFNIPRLVNEGFVDAGLIIHESRFCLSSYTLQVVHDLGKLYKKSFSADLPLGVLAVDKKVPLDIQQEFSRVVHDSFAYAKQHPREALEFSKAFAQEKSPKIIKRHIKAFVTPETYFLEPKDIESIAQFVKRKFEVIN